MPFNNHLKSYEDLITPYEETRAGFIALALEKNRTACSAIGNLDHCLNQDCDTMPIRLKGASDGTTVRYAGAAISVDTILSKIAEDIGFQIEKILVLPQGKGNSSQQMGKHGQEALRKCVYVWKKDK